LLAHNFVFVVKDRLSSKSGITSFVFYLWKCLISTITIYCHVFLAGIKRWYPLFQTTRRREAMTGVF
jgi:hypothetical protein